MAVGTVGPAVHRPQPGSGMSRIDVPFVGSSTDGTVPTIALPVFNGKVLAIQKIDGSPAPTASWTATLADANSRGVDASTQPYAFDDLPLTLTIGATTVHSAVGTVRIVYQRSL